MAMRSRGQLGGIEGWANPLWTLDTLLVTKLLPIKLGLVSPLQTNYSDDVDAVIRLDEETPEEINRIMPEIKAHYMSHGFIIKSSQTSVTKPRATMLRDHYYEGSKSDSSLKRLISVSSLNSQSYFNDRLDAASICSSVQSAIEGSNHVIAPMFLKWYRTFILSYKEMYQGLEDRNGEFYVVDDQKGIAFGSLSRMLYADYSRLQALPEEDWMRAVKNSVLETVKLESMKSLTKGKKIRVADLIAITHYSEIKTALMSTFLRGVVQRDATFSYCAHFLMMPERVGGMGVPLMIIEALAGHSDGFFKQMHYVKVMYDRYLPDRENLIMMFTAVMRGISDYDPAKESTKIIDTAYPLYRECDAATSIMKGYIKAGLREICQNRRVKQLLEMDEHLPRYKATLMDILRGKFWYRISSFFLSNSKFCLIETLTTKVLASDVFLRGLPAKVIRAAVLKVFKHNRTASRVLLRKPNPASPAFDFYQNLDVSLLSIRDQMFPAVNFVRITEPLYDDVLVTRPTGEHLLKVSNRPSFTYVGGNIKTLEPKTSSTVKIKTDKEQKEALFESLEEVKMYELVRGTQFILINSHKAVMETGQLGRESSPLHGYYSNIEQACDFTLSFYSMSTFKELVYRVLPPTGGEIAHRLASRAYRADSAIKALPNAVNSTDALVNQNLMEERDWVDSNINIEYLRFRLILAITLRKVIFSFPELQVRFDLMATSSIKDVREDFCLPRQEAKIDWMPASMQPGMRVDVDTVVVFQYASHHEKDIGMVDDSRTESRHLVVKEGRGTSSSDWRAMVVRHHQELINESMTLGWNMLKRPSWLKFFNRKRHLVVEWQDVSFDEAWQDIQTLLTDLSLQDFLQMRSAARGFNDEQAVLMLLKSSRSDSISIYNSSSVLREVLISLKLRDKPNRGKRSGRYLQPEALRRQLDEGPLRVRIMKYWIIRYGLDYQITGHTFRVDQSGTVTRTELLLSEGVYENDQEDDLITLTRTFELVTEMGVDMTLLQQAVAEVVADSKLLDLSTLVIYDAGQSSKTDAEYVGENKAMHAAISFINYGWVRPCDTFASEFRQFRKYVKWHEAQSATYSNVGIYDSRTNSDTFGTAKAVLTGLLRDNLIEMTDVIVDMAAGRGDFHHALEEAGIPHVSYYRPDLFTSVKLEPGMEPDPNVNITDPESVSSHLDKDVVIMDFSFLKGKVSGIYDVLKYLLDIPVSAIYKLKRVLIRLNSLSEGPPEDLWRAMLQSSDMRILYPTSNNYKPRYLYLWVDMRAPPIIPVRPSQSLTSASWYKTLVSSSSMRKEMSGIYDVTSRVHGNSITEMLPPDLSVEDIIADRKARNIGDSIDNHLSVIQQEARLVINAPMIVLDPGSGNRATHLMIKQTEFRLSEDFIRELGSESRTGTSVKRKALFETIMTYAEGNVDGRVSENVFLLDEEQLAQLAWQSPYRNVRRLASSVSRLRQDEDISLYRRLSSAARSMDTFLIAVDEARKAQPPQLRREQRLIRFALRILVYGKLKESYRSSINLALGLIKSSEIDRQDGLEIIRYVRMLAVMWPSLQPPSQYSMSTNDFLRDVETTMIPRARKAAEAPRELKVPVVNPLFDNLFEEYRKGNTGLSVDEMLGRVLPDIGSIVGAVPATKTGLEGLQATLISPSVIMDAVGRLGEGVGDALNHFLSDEVMGQFDPGEFVYDDLADEEDYDGEF
jgi:hypothetical protein